MNPNVSMEFTTAAFRVGHSQVSGTQTRIDNDGNVVATQSLADAFFDTPAQAAGADNFDALLRDLSSDHSQATDPFAADALRNALSAPPQLVDLISIDIQRERDLGLGTLNETRQALGLAPYTSFEQLSSDPTIQALYQQTYGSIDNVDLFMGGLAEDHAPDAAVGPTFQAIIEDQFQRMRDGDPYWWQNQNLPQDIQNIVENTTLGDIIARNTGTPALQQAGVHRRRAASLDRSTGGSKRVSAGHRRRRQQCRNRGRTRRRYDRGWGRTVTGAHGQRRGGYLRVHRRQPQRHDQRLRPGARQDPVHHEHAADARGHDGDGAYLGLGLSCGQPSYRRRGEFRGQPDRAGRRGQDRLSAANFIVAPGERIVVDHGNGHA